jgi:hypothetical protein
MPHFLMIAIADSAAAEICLMGWVSLLKTRSHPETLANYAGST